MNFVTTTELADGWGLLRPEGGTYLDDNWGLAEAIRREVDRSAAAVNAELYATLLPVLEILGEDRDRDRGTECELLELLGELGDFERVKVGGRPGWAKPRPRWIPIGAGFATVTGTQSAIEFGAVPPADRHDYVRRVALDDPLVRERLEAASAERQEFRDWLGEPE